MQDITTSTLFSTEQVAIRYGVAQSAIRKHLQRHADEIVENIHYLTELNSFGNETTKWTLRGIIKLGMFIRSPQAKNFRLWAEMELEKSINKELENARIARENNLRLVDKVSDLQATLINKANRHQRQINGYKSQIKQHNNQIVILKHELAKYEKAHECEIIDENSPKFKPFSKDHLSYKELWREYIDVMRNNNALKIFIEQYKREVAELKERLKNNEKCEKIGIELAKIHQHIGALASYAVYDDTYFLEHNQITKDAK
ncbi:hypothetical protein [Campylobacter majalis]|uniref:hypothetical protein n=1 Tax=Campylobacter majalis TaxID=2790656 RepID=UPI003D69290D